ncbi:MAG: hypothetical protein ACP5IZ_10830 [Thermoprotei archaeon]|jgi:hypothetical protein
MDFKDLLEPYLTILKEKFPTINTLPEDVQLLFAIIFRDMTAMAENQKNIVERLDEDEEILKILLKKVIGSAP